MTRVIFYSKLDDKQLALAKLVQQALQKRRQVTILAESEEAASVLSRTIWQNGATEFIPNVPALHPLANETPVVIDWQEKSLFQDDILINLSQQQVMVFSRFRELIELVSNLEDDKIAARTRYKFYRDRGYEIKHLEQAQLLN
jgi:DNA polymerase III subunit chi